VKRNPIFLSIAAIIAASAGLTGCGMFHQKSDYYSTAAESRPLEVPPDLDSPPNANELLVPPAGSGAGVAAAATSAQPAAPTNELRVTDSAQNTWTKVGNALDQAKIGKVNSRDEGVRSYVFDYDAPIPKPAAERHWYTAVVSHLGFGEGDPVKATLFIQVVDDAGASRVTVAGKPGDRSATAASLRVMQVLHDKIPGASLASVSVPSPAVTTALPPPAASSAAPASPTVSSAPPPISGSSTGSTDLHVADTVPNTWTRVGLALERAQLGALSGRDENTHTYTLDFSATLETKADGEHHWYTRVLHPFGGSGAKTEQVTRKLTVRVADDAGGARVSVEGDGSTDKETADAARHVANVLRERLT
jgi:uncharacterized lipoprotein